MEPISKANYKKSDVSTLSIGSSNEKQFAEKLKLAKAEALLRNTAQHKKWTEICQRNGEAAIATADLITERHEILEKSKNGEAVDWTVFDEITRKLKKNDIYLLESSELTRQNSVSEIKNLKKSDKVVNMPSPKIKLVKSEDTTTLKTEQAASIVENEPFEISDDNLVLLNLNYKKYILGESLAGYGDSEKLLLPLGELSRSLSFSIETDAEKGTATGWFISEDRTFELDMTKMEAIVDGEKIPFSEKDVKVVDEDLYVDSKLLSKWFPVDLNLNFAEMSLDVEPREKLPFQERLERKQGWNIYNRGSSYETMYPREYSKYELLGTPYVDINIGNAYTHNFRTEEGRPVTNYNLYSIGDLGKMSSEIYLAGNSEDNLNDSNFTFKRVDPDAHLLGPLNATSVAVGDIYTTRVEGAGGDLKERGISLSNRKLFRSREFDTTFFEGSLPPGWDVEVYRNDILMNSKRIGAEGKYRFDELPVNYGKNDYKLIFYGPQGQKRIETKNIDVGSNILKKGTGEYNVSLTQKNTDVYDTDTIDRSDKESPKINATFDYGINEKLSMGVGVSSQEVNSERKDYLNFNAKSNYKDIRLRGDYINDTEGGDALIGLAQTQIGKVNLNLKQKIYNGFQNNKYSQTDISAFGIIKGNSLRPDLRTSLSLQNMVKGEYHQTSLGSGIAANFENFNVNNYLQWMDIKAGSDNTTTLDGDFQVSSQMEDLRLGGSIDYDIKPELEITNAQLSGSYNITDNLTSNLFIKKNMQGDNDYEGSLRLNWNINNGKFVVSPSVSYNNDDVLTAKVNFSTSLGVDPKTKKFRMSSTPMGRNGAARVNIYNDKNNNSIFDNDDEVLEGASIKSVQAYAKAETDENGVAVFTDLQKYRPTDIILNKDSVEDPFLEPVKEGISIIPRPGHIQEINIPVIGTGEIDGTVYKEMKDGTEKPYVNIKLQLIDKDGNVVQETRSEYDGFYLFMKVPHGDYKVQIDPEELEKKGLTSAAHSDLTIVAEDNILSGRDFNLALLSKAKEPVVEAPKTIAEVEKTITDKVDVVKEPVKRDDDVNVIKTEPEEVVVAAQLDKTDDKEDVAYKRKPEEPPVVALGESTVREVVKEPASVEPVVKPEVDKVDVKKDVVWSAPEIEGVGVVKNEKFGLHLTSYRTSEKAIAGIDFLRKKYKDILGDSDFTVKKVHVSNEKGTWYRVFAGSFNSEEKAEKLKTKIEMAMPYCRVLSLDTGVENEAKKGVHLTSFRTTKKAMLSIQELKDQYPVILRDVDFSIKDVDLGSEKGKWKRVIAGNFSNEGDAKLLAKRIKMSSPYSKTMQIEENEEFGIHLASFKTSEKASRGLKILQKKFSSTLDNDDYSIRQVNIGDEIWYRVFSGRFKDKNAAAPIIKSLNNMKQYARMVNFSDPDVQRQ